VSRMLVKNKQRIRAQLQRIDGNFKIVSKILRADRTRGPSGGGVGKNLGN
jgi:hypothetical protein